MRSYHRGQAEPVGTLRMVAGANPPPGYLVCDGSTFDEGKYPRLADYLGGTTLPDYRDRALVGAGGTYQPGEGFGADSKDHDHGAATGSGGGHSHSASTSVNVYNRTLSTSQMPNHDHYMQGYGTGGGADDRIGGSGDAGRGEQGGHNTYDAGGGGSHDHDAGASTSVDSVNDHSHSVGAETLDVRQASRAATVCIRT